MEKPNTNRPENHSQYLYESPKDFQKIDFSLPDSILQLSCRLEKKDKIEDFTDGQEHEFLLDDSYELHLIKDLDSNVGLESFSFAEGRFSVDNRENIVDITFTPRPYDNTWQAKVYSYDSDIDRAICKKICEKLKIKKCKYVSHDIGRVPYEVVEELDFSDY